MLAQKRLQRELMALQKESPPLIRAKPLETNILNFHYVIEGPAGTPFAGGYYHGVLKFPSEYPHKPPSVLMYTPSGRFQPNTRICMSMSDFHPESWNPVWSVASILIGLQSFMIESSSTVGSVETTAEMKQRFAADSLEYNVKNNKDFCRLFPELVELHTKRVAAAAGGGGGSGAAAAAGSGSGAAAAAPSGSGAAAGPAAGAGAATAVAAAGTGKPVAPASGLLLAIAIAILAVLLVLRR